RASRSRRATSTRARRSDRMSFDLDPTYVIYGFAIVSAILFGEGAYLLFFSAASYRNRINRRLALLNDTVDRQSILVQIRRERGLTTGGDFRLPVISLNKDRKSTRLNSSHQIISYAVFCLKKKKKYKTQHKITTYNSK